MSQGFIRGRTSRPPSRCDQEVAVAVAPGAASAARARGDWKPRPRAGGIAWPGRSSGRSPPRSGGCRASSRGARSSAVSLSPISSCSRTGWWMQPRTGWPSCRSPISVPKSGTPRHERLRAVDRVEDPDELGVGPLGPEFLADDAVLREPLADEAAHELLGAAVGGRDRGMVRLELHLNVGAAEKGADEMRRSARRARS
jgi:hypothetical protein